MIKIVTDEDLYEMSCWLTPSSQDAPCANCEQVKRAIKKEDIKDFCSISHYSKEEAPNAILECKQCLWFWVDEVEEQ